MAGVYSLYTAGLSLVFLVVLMARTVSAQGIYPCHADRDNLGAPGCTEVTLPRDLCVKCPLKDVVAFGPNKGDFQDCHSIYNLDAPGCQGQLIEYVQMNHCDWRRAEQVDQWLNNDNEWVRNQAKEKLDYFVYSICEECCDCIPKSSNHLDYASAAWDVNKLFTHTRGNCAAHAYYDICKIWPNIKSVKNPGDSEDNSWWPNICGKLQDWFNNNQNWRYDHNVGASDDVQRFLFNVNFKTQCGTEQVWNNCRKMEQLQGNI